MDTVTVILVLLGITLVIMGIKWLLRAVLNKGWDAAENAIKKAREEKNPPKPESLAERYEIRSTQSDESGEGKTE